MAYVPTQGRADIVSYRPASPRRRRRHPRPEGRDRGRPPASAVLLVTRGRAVGLRGGRTLVGAVSFEDAGELGWDCIR